MEPQYPNIGGSRPRSFGQVKVTIQPSPTPQQQPSDNDRTNSDLRALDCNLNSLCDHIQMEGFNSGSFSDVVVHAMGSTYRLHRLILSRSSYFRNMLHGPWKEASSPVVNLNVDDKNVNAEAIETALAYLYGHHPKLDDNNAFRVLAAASFLDLQDLCAICTDFIVSELWSSNFLAYQVFAEGQDYGEYGERVRNACWGYLCQSGSMELKEVLPKLSSQTLHALLTSDELWVASEEKRFELALYTLMAKGALSKTESSDQCTPISEMRMSMHSDSSKIKGKEFFDNSKTGLGRLSLKDDLEGQAMAHNLLVDLVECEVDYQGPQVSYSQSNVGMGSLNSCSVAQSSPVNNSFSERNGNTTSCSYVEMPVGVGTSGLGGPSGESSYQLNNNNWLASDQSGNSPSADPSCNGLMLNDWGRCDMNSLSWGGRVVGKRQVKSYAKGNCGVRGEDYDTFVNIFEGGSLLYCNMSFEALLNVRKQLEELGFPCKAVNDGLWLQMLLSQRVQETGADTCKLCCFTSMSCTCRQQFGFSRGVNYTQEHEHNNSPVNMENVYVANSATGGGNSVFRPVRVHVRGPVDGLAGIGRGTTFVPAAAWPPTRFVFSRQPFGFGTRNGQQSPNDDSESRTDHTGDLSGDGLTALVGLSQGGISTSNVQTQHTERDYEADMQERISSSAPSTSGIAVQALDSPEQAIGIEWANENDSSISLDINTPLSHFPPFRFGVEFADVLRLSDGQVKHSPEFFYAGSLWKVSVQAFNDEDPQGRRTLGLFLHRRKVEITDSLRKVHMYTDSREKVTARYQLICPSKREVTVFGSLKQRGTLLPKAPKGWGWRTALLFDELSELLQNGALRVAAVIQLV
ncbi:Germ cell-less protein-like 1 [Linum perenne]